MFQTIYEFLRNHADEFHQLTYGEKHDDYKRYV